MNIINLSVKNFTKIIVKLHVSLPPNNFPLSSFCLISSQDLKTKTMGNLNSIWSKRSVIQVWSFRSLKHMAHNGHTWGDICGADIGSVCRWGSSAVACKDGGASRKGLRYSTLFRHTCNQKGHQHYHSIMPHNDMNVIAVLRQNKELSGIPSTAYYKANLNPNPFHNPYSIEYAVHVRTWRKYSLGMSWQGEKRIGLGK